MQQMFDLIVGKNVAYKAKTGGGTISGINEIDLLAPGAIAVFTEDNRLVETTTLASALAGVKGFYFAVGLTSGKVKQSNLIDRDAFHRAKCAYVAPVLQVTTVTSLGLPTTYISGEAAEVIITRHEEGREPMVSAERFSIATKATDTNTTFVQRLVDKINNNSNNFTAVATVAGTTFTITADNKNVRFDVAFRGIIQDAVATVTTVAVYSVGDADDMLLLEKEGNIYRGDTSPIWHTQRMFKEASEIVAGAQYVTYEFMWATETRNINVANVATPGVKAIFPTGAAVITSLDTILGILMPLIPNTGAGGAPFSTL